MTTTASNPPGGRQPAAAPGASGPVAALQPAAGQRDVLRQAVLALATAMGHELAALAVQVPPAPDYLERRAQQQVLLNQALTLETQQLQLIGDAGLDAAVAAIGDTTRNLQQALASAQEVARDAGIVVTVIGFVAAVLAGRPGDILAAARGVQAALQAPGSPPGSGAPQPQVG